MTLGGLETFFLTQRRRIWEPPKKHLIFVFHSNRDWESDSSLIIFLPLGSSTSQRGVFGVTHTQQSHQKFLKDLRTRGLLCHHARHSINLFLFPFLPPININNNHQHLGLATPKPTELAYKRQRGRDRSTARQVYGQQSVRYDFSEWRIFGHASVSREREERDGSGFRFGVLIITF